MTTDNEKNEILGLIAELARATADLHGVNHQGAVTPLPQWVANLRTIEKRANELRSA